MSRVIHDIVNLADPITVSLMRHEHLMSLRHGWCPLMCRARSLGHLHKNAYRYLKANIFKPVCHIFLSLSYNHLFWGPQRHPEAEVLGTLKLHY